MIGVSSAVLALSSYFLVSRGNKKGNEDIELSDSQDKDKSTISGNKANTSKPVQNIDKKKAVLNQLLKNRGPSPTAITNTKKSNQKDKQSDRGEKINRLIPLLTTALTNKEKVGRLNETNAQTKVGPRVQNPKASLQDNQNRIDKMGVILNNGQVPLVKSRYLKYIYNEEHPYGINAVVAIGCYGGYNVEDSILFNEGSIKRGMFNTTYFNHRMERIPKN